MNVPIEDLIILLEFINKYSFEAKQQLLKIRDTRNPNDKKLLRTKLKIKLYTIKGLSENLGV